MPCNLERWRLGEIWMWSTLWSTLVSLCKPGCRVSFGEGWAMWHSFAESHQCISMLHIFWRSPGNDGWCSQSKTKSSTPLDPAQRVVKPLQSHPEDTEDWKDNVLGWHKGTLDYGCEFPKGFITEATGLSYNPLCFVITALVDEVVMHWGTLSCERSPTAFVSRSLPPRGCFSLMNAEPSQ